MLKTVTCTCCRLRYEVPAKGSVLDQNGHCSICKLHLSTEMGQSLKRAREHEAMLFERLQRYTKFAEAKAIENGELKQKNFYAYRTRDKTVGILRKIADVHAMRPNGECTCKSKNCRVAVIMDDRLVQNLIANAESVQRDMRARDEIVRSLEWWEREDEADILRENGLEYLAMPEPVARRIKDGTA